MPTIDYSYTMPEGLEDFPWGHLMHLWDFDSYRTGAIKLRLWYPPGDEFSGDAEDYVCDAFKLHCEIWSWLVTRFVMARVPEFETEGDGFLVDGEQMYKRCACWGIFSLARAT